MKDSDIVYKEIFKIALGGGTISEIAHQSGFSTPYINKILRIYYGLDGETRTQLKYNKIISEYNQHADIGEIAKKWGLSKGWVEQIIRNEDIVRRKIPEHIKDMAVKLYQSGSDINIISEKLGIDATTISKYVKNYTKTKQCPICGDRFETKRKTIYCDNCRQLPSVYNVGMEQRKCDECGRLFTLKYKTYKYKGLEHFYCSRYCVQRNRSRIGSNRLKNIYSLLSVGKTPKDIANELNISIEYCYKLLKGKDKYLDLPPLYWSSDELVLKHNKWETSLTKTNLLLRAKRERRAFNEWEQDKNGK